MIENFGKVERTFYGDQKYRACEVNDLPEGLLYATDSPLDKDYIFLLNPDTGELKEIMPIAGSCIYGCKWKGALTAIWQFCRYLFWPQWGSQCRRVLEKYERMLEEGRVNK